MAQINKSLTDLLGDGDDEDEDDDAGQGSNEFQALLRGSAIKAEPSQPGHNAAAPPAYPHQQAPASSVPPQNIGPPQRSPGSAPSSSGSVVTSKHVVDFCKEKLSPEAFQFVASALHGIKAGSSEQQRKEAMASIQRILGQKGQMELRDYIQKKTMESTAAQAAGRGQSGGSIMQSLKYNAEAQDVVPGRPPPNAPQHGFPSPANYPQVQRSQPPPYSQPPGYQPPRGPPQQAFNAPGQERVHTPQPQQLSHMRPPAPSAVSRQPETAPAAKRQKKGDIEEEMDILKDSGIDLEAEERALLGTMKPAEAPSRQVAAVPDESFLNEGPLMHKVLDIAKRQGLESVNSEVLQLLSRGLDAHFSNLVKSVFAMTRQRTDSYRTRAGMVLTDRIRTRLQEINNREREQQQALNKVEVEAPPAQMPVQAQGTKRKQPGEDSKKADKPSMKDSEKMQASAANAAAAAAFGGGKSQKWGAWSADSAKKGTTAPRPELPKPATAASTPPPLGTSTAQGLPPGGLSRPGHVPGGGVNAQGSPALAPSRVKAAALTARLPDLVAAMERDPMYMKSTLLYKLYDQLPE